MVLETLIGLLHWSLVSSSFLVSVQPQRAPAVSQRPAQLGGVATVVTIDSSILSQARSVAIAPPASFQRTGATRRYPLILVLDGQSLLAPTAAMSATLAEHGLAPEAIVVGIDQIDRLHELTPPGLSISGSGLDGGGDRFLDFLERELLPTLERDWRAGKPRVLVGHSSGAVLATWAAATRDAFPFVLALDVPAHLGDHRLARALSRRARARPASLRRYATLEARFGWSDAHWRSLEAAAPAGWRLHREALEGESHQSMPTLGVYLGLRTLFADYSMLEIPPGPTASLLDRYAELATDYGDSPAPPLRLLRQVVEDLLIEGRGRLAGEVYQRLVSAYGVPEDDVGLARRISEVANRPPPAETVEGLLARPFPEPADVGDLLGSWRGESWTRPEVRQPLALRLRIENGKVVGEVSTWPAPDVELAEELAVLEVGSGGLAFGYLNRMRPRGVLLYEGAREGEVLEGTMRLAGVDFRLPDGRALPETRFRLVRASP